MTAALLGALITNIGLPELENWLISLHQSSTPITDAVIIAKLVTDTNIGEQIGNTWLVGHGLAPVAIPPPTPVAAG